MFQSILIGILLLIAAGYLGHLAYRSFTTSSCESGCGKCGAIDATSILKTVNEKKSA